ncbi:MAG: DNA topoisomerase IV subunit A [Bacilli bacterium]|nr:DNA topoisomerase IV subunit A [Bacilli bacterium]MDD4809316.1 DNA topoisomerase IV subunit A [Bacilli bacterium]
MQEVLKKIYDYSLEEIMGERFGRYAKTIIQDRAIPDVRDGLKPVQRRILYAMYKSRNTSDKPFKKCGETVGEVMGKYHPHGDSSIYDAMVRMSQWWKQNTILVDMHGNNGSMDGDSAAAYRYTEARLSSISNELLKDLEKNTVSWAPNYSDTLLEPTVLPAKFPNLLVNGANGISAGYATNIPPHNLSEVIDATIKRIDNPNCRLDTIIDIVKGPDFPTGGIVEGIDGIRGAYDTGRGKVVIRAKIDIEKNKKLDQIIVTEIPYDVNKGNLVKKIDEIRMDKKIDGITEVRDESDRENPVRIVIDLKSNTNSDLILKYLLKNTELQISYNFNMVAIVRNRPMTLGLLPILDAYIDHQSEIITKRTEFDLEHAKARVHIVEGLVKALSILDEVITTIRQSKNRADAKNNLIIKYGFTDQQAEAIIILQLYKLTNTDVTELLEEQKNLNLIIKGLEAILTDPEKLKGVIKDELRKIKKEYGSPRKTEIKAEITEIKIDTTLMLPKEDCIVVVTKEGYLKRVSSKSYNASEDETLVKEGDYVIGLYEMNTMDTLLLFTDFGNYLFIPCHELPDLKWKELGKHVSNIIDIDPGENIIGSIPVNDFEKDEYITIFTKDGMIKKTKLIDFKVQRYSKPLTAIKLKDNDKVVSVTNHNGSDILITTKNGYALRYSTLEVSPTGVKAAGVKSINLKNDIVVSGLTFTDNEYLVVITDKSTGKRIKMTELEKTTRARKGVQIIRDVKTNPYYIIRAMVYNSKDIIGLKNDVTIDYIKPTELTITNRYSTGSVVSKHHIKEAFIVSNLVKPGELEIEEVKDITLEEVEDVSLEKVDEKIMTIDDFLDDFKI